MVTSKNKILLDGLQILIGLSFIAEIIDGGHSLDGRLICGAAQDWPN